MEGALQEYGAVCVDGAHGNVIYAEGFTAYPGRSWTGLLDPWNLRCIAQQLPLARPGYR